MNMSYLTEKVCKEIRLNPARGDILATVIRVLVREGVDIRRDPGLAEMKALLVEAHRAARQLPVVLP